MKIKTNKILSFALALTALALSLSAVQSASAYSFVETGTMNTGRYVHTATLLASGQVMVAGGFNGNIGEVAGTETYNPATGSWTTNGDMINPRSDHTATLLPNGKVLVAGGDDFTGALTNAELFDPASGTWTATGSLTNSRTYHAAALNFYDDAIFDFIFRALDAAARETPASSTIRSPEHGPTPAP